MRRFKDRMTEAVFGRQCPKRFPSDLFSVTRRKILALDFAAVSDDLRSPLGNRLEALAGDRANQHSIRINSQFRICFRLVDDDADDIEFTDCHEP